ncbi:MAG: hypothetical protein JNN13_03685 [Planctomycetes bacterium]|nr:hypothetical protein [Planctomycetota bacterium]
MLPSRNLRRFPTSRPSADCRSRRPTLAALGMLAALTFGAGTAAQAPLVYSNGEFETDRPWWSFPMKFSQVQSSPPIEHSVFGYNVTKSLGYRLIDQFTVNSVLQISDIEVFGYTFTFNPQPSCTGVYLSIWNGDPSAGSPTQLILNAGNSVNLLGAPGFTVANTMTDVFRVSGPLISAPLDKAIQSIRVTLQWPVTLGPGTYYLEYALDGIAASPPLTTRGVATTGDAKQYLPGVGYVGILSGATTPYKQGLPFNFYSSCCPPFTLPGAITNLGGGCSGASLSVAGAAAVGGYVRAELANVNPLTFGVILLGVTNPNIPLLACSCTSHASADLLLLGTDYELHVPIVGSLAGAELFFQGAQLNLSGTSGTTACNLGLQFDLTDGYSYRLNIN